MKQSFPSHPPITFSCLCQQRTCKNIAVKMAEGPGNVTTGRRQREGAWATCSKPWGGGWPTRTTQHWLGVVASGIGLLSALAWGPGRPKHCRKHVHCDIGGPQKTPRKKKGKKKQKPKSTWFALEDGWKASESIPSISKDSGLEPAGRKHREWEQT